jgi:hypothetical protein
VILLTAEYIYTGSARAKPPPPALFIELASLSTRELRALGECVVKTVCGSHHTESGFGVALRAYCKIEAETLRRELDEAGTQLRLFDPDVLT